MIGTTILQYNILDQIGRGGMGVVYKAMDTKLQRIVALKFLPEDFQIRDTDKARFVREARAASAINHSNVCTIYDLKEVRDKQFIVMEYVEGQTLKSLIQSETEISLKITVDYMIQVAKALQAAHDKGIIHRDVKSENIMVTPDGHIKVMDFGLARMKGATELTKTATTAGTVAYMSPEQLDGRDVDTRTDIFSFGVVFYELLAGHLPFKGESPSTMINSILNKEPVAIETYREDCPPSIDKIIQRTLAKNVKARYEAIQDVLDDLSLVQKSRYTIPGPDVKKQHRKKSRRKHRLNLWVPIAVVTLLLFILGITIISHINGQKKTFLQIIPLTRGGGKAERAQFSPDGTQVVYDYLKDDQTHSDIYIQQLGTNQVFQLTSHPESDLWPVWSPHGKYVAFCRSSGDPNVQGIYLISSLGGVEQKLNSKNCQHLCWSPDGQTLAFSHYESGAIFLMNVKSRQERQLTFPQISNVGIWVDQSPAFSPDGKYLAFVRCESFATCAIFIIPVSGGDERQITFENEQIFGLTWAPGNRILFSSNRAVGRKLWSIKTNGRSIKLISVGGKRSFYPVVSNDGKRLLYTEFSGGQCDIGRIKVPNQNAVTPQEIIVIEGHDCWPDVSPDGSKLTFVSVRTGYSEVWTSDTGGQTLQQVTTLENYTGRPRWSPDGQYITFDSRPHGNSDIFVIPAAGGAPVQLTSDSLDEVLPNWSRDGEWIYYCTRNKDDNQIYRVPSKGGTPQRIVTRGGLMAFEGVDREFLYVQKLDDPEIWRYPHDGSEESLVFARINDYRKWGLNEDGIYYFSQSDEDNLWRVDFYHFATKEVTTLATIKDIYDISAPVLSPDGQYLYFHYIEKKTQSDIFLVGNFE